MGRRTSETNDALLKFFFWRLSCSFNLPPKTNQEVPRSGEQQSSRSDAPAPACCWFGLGSSNKELCRICLPGMTNAHLEIFP
ncbi:hypothetical protein MHYP_G00019490 [Metynnis hypsauchen]